MKPIAIIKDCLNRATAITLIAAMLHMLMAPMQLFALTGGPSQPEVQSFEPVGTSEMVNLFTGDFSYNIPLMDVGGYPINISYHGGIGMDDEASWTGLGWNINPGVINRQMRGLPDDFKGDIVTRELNMKPNQTFGVAGSVSAEIAGVEGLSLGASLGISYNNYNGIGMDIGVNASITAGSGDKGALNGSLGINSSSESGLTISPGVSFGAKINQTDYLDGDQGSQTLSMNIGTAINSRAGMKQMTIGTAVNGKIAREAGTRNESTISSVSNGINATFNYGTPTFVPKSNFPMKNFAMSGRVTAGGEIFSLHPNFGINGYFSSQWLATNSLSTPAYGYMHADEGQNSDNVLHDFNREKDFPFAATTPRLPVTNQTFDIYGVNAQGVGGSYRAVRNDLGFLYDASSKSTNSSGSVGVDLGFGNAFHIGGDVGITAVTTNTNAWRSDSKASENMGFRDEGNNPSFEKFSFKSASDAGVNTNQDFINNIGGDQAVRIDIVGSKFNRKTDNKLLSNNGSSYSINQNVYRKNREPKAAPLSFLTWDEVDDFSLSGVSNPNAYPDHHIAEVTITNTSGGRYIFGQPAYNKLQHEATFAVGKNNAGQGGYAFDCETGLVDFNNGDNTVSGNNLGSDNYVEIMRTPAYAHSYLLTNVVSSDYIDFDNTRGPSDGDLGSWTKFHYAKIENYKWRAPFTKASHNAGLNTDKGDDKASYIYGEKELYYLDSIVNKNFIAIFHKSNREDGVGVKNENEGGFDASLSARQQKLDSISLYVRPDFKANGYNATLLKRVHFKYSYDLCPSVPNNTGAVVDDGEGGNANVKKGKLTLEKIYFTYENSNKGRFSPYTFNYDQDNPDSNPAYVEKDYDRWGNYKKGVGTNNCGPMDPLSNPEFSYVDQNKDMADQYAQVWSLKSINLPSGGKMMMEYESDDYAYVQDKKAMEMFKVVGTSNCSPPTSATDISTNFQAISLSDTDCENRYLVFEMKEGYNNIEAYFEGMEYLYFRFLMRFDQVSNWAYDYVSGYAEIGDLSTNASDAGNNNKTHLGTVNINGTNYGFVRIKSVDIGDGNNNKYNPITKASVQFGRLHLAKFINDQTGIDESMNFGAEMMDALINSNIAANLAEMIIGPNKWIWNLNKGREFVGGKSWIRLNNPNQRKLGGGCRVKSVIVSDEWASLSGAPQETMSYGQEYYYDNEDGSSSGVAAYEPLLGGDENPFRVPIYYDVTNKLAPDYRYYLEEPMGESFFPSPMVGYSRVTVKNLSRENVSRHATGNIVNEFYTAKDFPTITGHTDREMYRDVNPFSINSLFNINVKDHLTVSQGYSVELNDMHGKQKKTSIYAEGEIDPLSSVEYRYKADPYLSNAKRLNSKVDVLDSKGNITEEEIAVFYDFVADMREQKTNMNAFSAKINLDGFYIPPFFFLVLPMVWPSIASEKTQFRSAVTTKVIQRNAILYEVEAQDLGSVVTTKNLAYDKVTGGVLVTEVNNSFDDAIYNLNIPAHWYHNQMAPAFKNLMLNWDFVTFDGTGSANIIGADRYFIEGDEIAITQEGTSNKFIGWITRVGNNSITVQKRNGDPVMGSNSFKVLRSGGKNIISANVASLTSLVNPLANNAIKNNLYQEVVSAGAIEYGNGWNTYCDCVDPSLAEGPINAYALGIKGHWRVKRNHAYLTGRKQELFNNNSNIRKDGVFTSFSPFYRLNDDGTWNIDRENWTYAAEVTQFSPFGQELENKDALGRYSSATFGYNGSLPTAVAANTQYSELGFDNFEDYDYNLCIDGHFKFNNYASNITNQEAHSGRRSLKVNAGSTASIYKEIVNCNDQDCDLEINTLESDYFAVNGLAPFSFSWEIIAGFPTIIPNTQGNAIKILAQGNQGYTVQITVRDANDCVAHYMAQINPTAGSPTGTTGSTGITGSTGNSFPGTGINIGGAGGSNANGGQTNFPSGGLNGSQISLPSNTQSPAGIGNQNPSNGLPQIQPNNGGGFLLNAPSGNENNSNQQAQ